MAVCLQARQAGFLHNAAVQLVIAASGIKDGVREVGVSFMDK
jgi:hypothetical protein